MKYAENWPEAYAVAHRSTIKFVNRCPFHIFGNGLHEQLMRITAWEMLNRSGGKPVSYAHIKVRALGACKDACRADSMCAKRRGNLTRTDLPRNEDWAGTVTQRSTPDKLALQHAFDNCGANPRDMVVFKMIVVDGAALGPVAEALKVTPARVSQIVSRVRRQVAVAAVEAGF